MKSISVLTAAYLAFSSLAGANTFTLPQLAELAEQNSPAILRSRQIYEHHQLDFQNARARFLPSLDLEAVHGSLDSDPSERITPVRSLLSLKLKETFYDNGASITKFRQARRAAERTRIEYENLRDEHLVKVAEAYYDWSASLQFRQLDQNKQDLLRRQYRILEAHYKQGLKTKRDVLRIETEIRRLQLAILDRDNEIQMSLQKLASHIGVDRKYLAERGISSEVAKAPVKVPEKVEDLDVKEHRQFKIFELKNEEAVLGSNLVEREYWPRISLNGEINYKNEDYLDNPNGPYGTDGWGWSALLKIEYNLWDFGIRNRDRQVARIKAKMVESENLQKRLDLETELRKVTLELRKQSETVKMTDELLKLEQQSYNVLEAEYRNGRASYLDLITSLNQLIDARFKFMTSYFSLKKQNLQYDFHQGKLYENIKQK